MKYEFGVARSHHCSGQELTHLEVNDFPLMKRLGNTQDKKMNVDLLFILSLMRNMFFTVHRMQKAVMLHMTNQFLEFTLLKANLGGQVETCIWWAEFKKNPSAFYHLAEGKIGG